ncbi:MAG: hypothetical protein EA396_01115 [Anaerolineaceae bacterium]|nr:MAG: hypothetical protein EA396_01115 [Anaerolineaceae bacterium]
MQIRTFPPLSWALSYPRLSAWVILSAGMIALLVIEARDIGLSAGNWLALIVATVLVAGACVWIVSWEDADDSADSADDAPADDTDAPADSADAEKSAETTT